MTVRPRTFALAVMLLTVRTPRVTTCFARRAIGRQLKGFPVGLLGREDLNQSLG
ncbi:uncharacterized protein METZ01_LOCUS509361, partial [marine metagenome]